MFRRFGSQVTVLEHGDRLIAREDPEISAEVRAILEREGVRFIVGVRDGSAMPQDGGVRIRGTSQGTSFDIGGSHVLVAVGRKPNTDDLGLVDAGVAVDARGFIDVDDQCRTNVPGIWALGDVNGRGAFTHTSYNDYEIVASSLLGDAPRGIADRIPAYALFIDPPLGRVGMTEAEVRATGRPALVGVMPMTRVSRARERGETQGFMKVLVDAESERILGASLLCSEGDEIVHSILDVMAADASYKVIERAVHIHPTVSELIPTLLGQLEPLKDAPTTR
jgi:pyruvate/2-oxoglutarate dehydrogenase complex dihydrolipoamide dehydrogenase (E3) component